MNKILVRLTIDVDPAKMCDYQIKKLCNTLTKQIRAARALAEAGTLKPDFAIHVPDQTAH